MNGQLALDMTAGPLYRPTDPVPSRAAAGLAPAAAALIECL